MDYLQGIDRNQISMFCLESAIPDDAFVRFVDTFVDATDLKDLGFLNVDYSGKGRSSYHPSILLKLYLYGNKYGIKASRKLEREARTNIEAIWLLAGLRPGYKTIADFRKNNSKAFQEAFLRFASLKKNITLKKNTTNGKYTF